MLCNLTIQIKGMTCGGCTSSVRRALQAVQGVESVVVDLKSQLAEIVFDDTFVDPRTLRAAIVASGYEPVIPDA